MGIYAIAKWGDPDETYGEAPRISFSVAPFVAFASAELIEELDEAGKVVSSSVAYDTVELTWAPPEGDISKIRLVRSQDGWAETEEDGVILWEWSSDSDAARLETFTDSPANSPLPLVSGRYAYYRMWVLRESSNTWVVAGDSIVLVPKPHHTSASDGTVLVTTHDKFMDLLPRVFTSENQSPLDVVDKSSELYRFLQGFSFTLDEVMTLADNILPEESGRYLSPELVILKTKSLGLEPEAYISTKNQKRLVREATYILANKGTSNAVQTYAEALTGLAPVVTSSPNLMLSVQDSSFYKSVGFWHVIGDGYISVEQTVLPPSTTLEPNAIDTAYCGKLVADTPNIALRNGTIVANLTGSPVSAGSEYSLSFYTQALTTANTVTPTILWYDYLGNLIKTSTGTSSAVPAGNWAKASFSAVAPGRTMSVSSYSLTSNVVTLVVDGTIGYEVGDSVVVFDVASVVNGTFTITAKTPSSISYAKTNADIASTAVTSGAVVLEDNPAAFAGVELKFGSAGTVYVDMVQVAPSAITSYYEARAVDIFLNPKKTNEIKNPSFEGLNFNSWTITPSGSSTGASVLSTDGVSGSHCLQVPLADGTTTLATETGVIDDGRFFTFSTYLKQESLPVTTLAVASNQATITVASVPSTWLVGDDVTLVTNGAEYDELAGSHEILAKTSTTVTFAVDYADVSSTSVTGMEVYLPEVLTLQINGYDASAPVGSQVFDTHSHAVTLTNEWVRYNTTGYVSSSPNNITVQARITGTTRGAKIRVDDVQLEASYSPTDYFDGNSPASYGAVWEGLPNNSRSHIYPNKSVKTLRLAETVRDFLPINRPHTIRTYAGIEHKIIE